MPLSRLEVRNVNGIGQTQLYKNVDREDPEAILNGVAISGLVGILRQLGDLAEFAAEVFHGIQEEVIATASRSNQLKIRLQHIEATVSPLEKAVLAQTSHIHFAYTGGIEWHPRILNEQNQLIYNDLPRVIMDPYEDCRDPPRLHLLDKFDINGPGSCLKRYSDPTYFRRASRNQSQRNNKFQKDKKKIKKKKSSSRSRDMSRLASMANQDARKTFSFSGQTSSSKTASTIDMEKISDLQDHQSHSFDSRSASGNVEWLLTATSSLKTGEKPKGVFVSSSLASDSCTITTVLSECETEDAHDNFQFSTSKGQAACGSSCVSWDEKAEIVESLGQQSDEASEMMEMSSVVDALDEKASYGEETHRVDFHSKDTENAKSESGLQKRTPTDDLGEIKTGLEIVGESRDSEYETESEGDCFVDAHNTIDSESENDQGLQTCQEVVSSSCGVTDERLEKSLCEQKQEQNSNCVEAPCRSMDGLMDYGFGNDEKSCSLVEMLSSSYASDKMNHKDPQMSLDITRSPCNDLCTSKMSSGEDNNDPLYHSDLQEHKNSEAEISFEVEAIKIWTNGGLLGLKPSKPPVLAVPSSSSQDCNTDERKVAPADDRKTLPATIPENDEVRTVKSRSCDQDIDEKTLMDPFRDEAPIDWFTSSPPLQHMKISLNPIDTLQASRLKLKFSDGDNNYNTFSSFQLLPEAATSLPDSYSDDDTFCRSSPYMSDTDYLSDNHSLSNSEQWEESSNSHKEKNSSPLEIESESGSVSVNLSYLQNLAETLPPPFPPVQWMTSKTPSEKVEDKTQSLQLQDTLKFVFEKHISLSTVNKELPNMVTSAPKPEVKVHLKNNVRENKESASSKETETGDFLQQIRTQQINLRPVVMTTTLSAATTTDPTINTKISAILEKANSIRQAVANEDGYESDSWSDT